MLLKFYAVFKMASHVFVIYLAFITLAVCDVPSSALNNQSKYQYPPGSLVCTTHDMTDGLQQ